MAGIRFENQDRWMVANWVFDRFLSGVIKSNQHQRDVVDVLTLAIYHNGLHLDLVRARHGELASRILDLLRAGGRDIVKGSAKEALDMGGDLEGQRLFREAISNLMEIISKQPKEG
jgi:hypothetical protein